MKFNLDSKVYQYLMTLTSYVALNLLFLLLCLPVFTIGAAYKALLAVSLTEAAGEYGYIFRGYLSAFKKHFGQSLLAELIFAALLSLFFFATVFWYRLDESIPTGIASVLSAVLLGATLCAADFAAGLMARHGYGALEAVKTGFSLVSRHRLYALLFVAIDALLLYFGWRYAGFRIYLLFIGFSFAAYLKAWLMLKVFSAHEEGGAHGEE